MEWINAFQRMPKGFMAAYWTLMGAAIGSFLNVCIYRIPRGESILHPRSRCPNCRMEIRWYQNIPIASWLFLRGRCSGCGKAIRFRYLVVEAWTALTFYLEFSRWGWSRTFFAAAIFSSTCIALFFIDWEWKILPDRFTLTGIAIGLLLVPFQPIVSWKEALSGLGFGLVLPMALIWGYWLWRKEEGMGLGDVKLMGMIGVFLGFTSFVLVLLLASIGGIIAGVFSWKQGDDTTRFGSVVLPFGTFLCGAAWVAVLWGPSIIRVYEHWMNRLLSFVIH